MTGYTTATRTGPGVGYSHEQKYSVTQYTLEDYSYVKWWDGRPVLKSNPRKYDKSVDAQTDA